MFKDGTLYFVSLLFANIAIAVTFFKFTGLLKAAIASWAPALSAVLVNRMIINLRAFYGSETNTMRGTMVGSGSNMEWASAGNSGQTTTVGHSTTFVDKYGEGETETFEMRGGRETATDVFGP